MIIVNNGDGNNNVNNTNEEEITLKEEVNIDQDIEKNISSYLAYGSAAKGIIILATCIMTIMFFANEEPGFGFLVLIIGLLSAFITSMVIKWFGYALKCLYDIRNNTKK